MEHFRKSIEIRESLLDEEGQTTPEESFIHIDDIGLESIILKYGKLIECYEDSLPLDISDGYIWSVYFGNNPDRSINDGDQVTLISEIHILHIYI